MTTQFTTKFAAFVLAAAINALMIVSIAYLFDSHLSRQALAILSA